MSIAIPQTRRDKNYWSYDKEQGVTFKGRTFAPERPQDYEDILKVSACRRCRFEDMTVTTTEPCNREDGIDISYLCDDIVFDNFRVDAGRLYAVTVKQCRNILLQNGTIGRPGGGWERVDIDLGNRSQYRSLRTTDVVIDNVHRLDGQPVRVRVGHADRPTLRNGIYDVLTLQSIGLKAFVWSCARIDAWNHKEFEILQWEEITEARYAR